MKTWYIFCTENKEDIVMQRWSVTFIACGIIVGSIVHGIPGVAMQP